MATIHDSSAAIRAATRDRTSSSQTQSDAGLGYRGFIAFTASIMALNALAIDCMLPALPAIGRSLNIASENERQWIIVVYMASFGVGQVIWGPIADRFGRKVPMVWGMIAYTVASLFAGFAGSFAMLLVTRVLQGIACSAARIMLVSIVRDCYSGRTMARVMSLAFMVFLAVPMLAPSIGQVISAFFGSWRAIFLSLGLYGLIVATVATLRLRETLHPEYRQPLTFASVAATAVRVCTTRVSIGYTIGAGLSFGCIAGMITSIQQIFADIFHIASWFPAIFAGLAAGMAIASYLNSRLVERLGTRKLSHSALLGFITVSLVHFAVAASGHETLVSFVVLLALVMFCVGLVGPNFNSMAMEPMGDIAGSAASLQGAISTCLGAVVGSLIGQSFHGTTVPLTGGFALAGLLMLVVVFVTEGGRLFQPRHAQAV
jgi:DHA1 family bicyclomycin/chloramphenicol resistance-like MFS transporter